MKESSKILISSSLLKTVNQNVKNFQNRVKLLLSNKDIPFLINIDLPKQVLRANYLY